MKWQQRASRFAPETLALDPLLARLYAARVDAAEEVNVHWRFLKRPELGGLEAATQRLQQARDRGEQVIIYGDYDVDGCCATALLLRFLSAYGMRLAAFIPDRQREGYGLNPKGIKHLIERYPDTQLIITVDNGIKAHEGSALLSQLGIDLIITDHHLADEALPPAVAIINPQVCGRVSPHLSGVGVAFYWAWFIQECWGEGAVPVSRYLDWVALGTLADLVPLDYNNRILCAYGLAQLRREPCLGLAALMQLAGVTQEALAAEDIAFAIAPRLNALGRLHHMRHALNLLLCDNSEEALQLAQFAEDCNRERKQLEQALLQTAQIADEALAWCYQPEAHEGVLGVAAAKIKQSTGRSALVACDAQEQDWLKASLRTVTGQHAKALLDAVAPQLPSDAFIYGGHAAAAGLSVRRDAFNLLIQLLNQILTQQPAPEALLEHDGALPAAYFNLDWARYLQTMEAWGSAFPPPLFCNRFRILEHRYLGQGREHSRLRLQESASGGIYEAVYFFHPPEWKPQHEEAALLFSLNINRFRGAERLQLAIQTME